MTALIFNLQKTSFNLSHPLIQKTYNLGILIIKAFDVFLTVFELVLHSHETSPNLRPIQIKVEKLFDLLNSEHSRFHRMIDFLA